MPKLRPLSKPDEIAAVPVDEPVLIELTAESSAVSLPSEPPVETVVQEPVSEKIEVPSEPEPEPEEVSPLQKQLDELRAAEALAKRQLADSQAKEAEALRLANQRGVELRQAHGERQQAQYDAILNAISAAQSEADTAQNDLAVAMSEQDYVKAAEAQRRLSVATSRLVQLDDGKVAFESHMEAVKNEPPPREPRAVDPIDANPNLSSAQKSWFKQHREVQSNQAQMARLGAAHWDALEAGHPQDSENYFKFLDERLGFSKKQDPAPAPQPQRKSVPMSAPVSRDTPSLSSGKMTSTRVELTPAQREAARIAGVDDVTYARNLLRLNSLKQQGHYQERG